MGQRYLKLGGVLKKLLFERDMRPVDLSRQVNLPPTTIHRLITGKSTRPYQSSLKPIADYFSVSVEQLLGESPLTHETINSSAHDIHHLPIVPWKSLLKNDSDKNHLIPFLGTINKNSFATVVPDSSMEPQFSKNNILIFDSSKKPYDRSFVLAKLSDSIFIFRQLLIDGENHFLKPLNPDLNNNKIRLLHKNDCIVAVLIEARHTYFDPEEL